MGQTTVALIDICVNLLNSQFNDDRPALLSRAGSAGVAGILITGTNLATSAAAIKHCQAPAIFCTAGVHPHDAAELPDDWLAQLTQLASHPSVRAIGETGLDFFRNFCPRALQLEAFNAQIELAVQLNKPLFVHDRDSQGEVLSQLQQYAHLPPVVVHCFTGSAEELGHYLAAGFYIGITGWIADRKRGGLLRQLVGQIPLDRLLIETDAPFLRPHNVPADFTARHHLSNQYKRRNEPAMLPYVLEAVAEHRAESAAEIAAATHNNASQLFGFSVTE